jgi:hypothetical protein
MAETNASIPEPFGPTYDLNSARLITVYLIEPLLPLFQQLSRCLGSCFHLNLTFFSFSKKEKLDGWSGWTGR